MAKIKYFNIVEMFDYEQDPTSPSGYSKIPYSIVDPTWRAKRVSNTQIEIKPFSGKIRLENLLPQNHYPTVRVEILDHPEPELRGARAWLDIEDLFVFIKDNSVNNGIMQADFYWKIQGPTLRLRINNG